MGLIDESRRQFVTAWRPGLKLQATDVDWQTGEGPAVTGPCMSLILGMVGRTGALADCDGPGMETLRARA